LNAEFHEMAAICFPEQLVPIQRDGQLSVSAIPESRRGLAIDGAAWRLLGIKQPLTIDPFDFPRSL
jgi:hypothetical protein